MTKENVPDTIQLCGAEFWASDCLETKYIYI